MDEHIEKSKDFYRQGVKVGVYICHCGGNISDVIDVKEVVKALSSYHGVAVSTDYVFMCSSTGQTLIEDDIKNKGINRVVIAACSPTLHKLTFRGTLERAGLNPYLYEHVNIREQDSWVHKSNKKAATQKAIRLVKAAVEKISRQNPLSAIRVSAEKAIAVVGGGIAGMNAALSLAKLDYKVYLIEKENRLGGRLNDLGNIYPGGARASDIVSGLEKEIRNLKNIEILENSELKEVSGYVGNFEIEIGNSIDKSSKKFKAGSIIITSGHKNYIPYDGEYGYLLNEKIITLPKFIEMLKSDERGEAFKEIKNIAFIHCVGSRHIQGVDKLPEGRKLNEYCSRICCTSTIYSINQLLDKYPQIQVYDFYRDIRTYGLQHESYYEDLSKKGVVFFRYADTERPIVKVSDGKISISAKDVLTWNEEIEVDADMLVLSTGIMPADISLIVDKLKLPIGTDGFLLEAHPKLRPVEVPNLGIYIGGTAQAPMDSIEASYGGKAAASKAALLLSSGEIILDPFVAFVDRELCDGCEKCVSECLYPGAIVMEEGKARVLSPLCKGCGACAAICPKRAINLAGYSLDQLDAMVDAIAKE